MGEAYANSAYYYDFTVTPALPAGSDARCTATGKISGTAHDSDARHALPDHRQEGRRRHLHGHGDDFRGALHGRQGV